MNRASTARGFTLIELLVVMAIIAILATLSLAAVGRARDAALGTLCLSNIRQLQLAWQSYATDEGELPIQYGDDTLRAKPGSWIVGDAREDGDDYNLRRGTLFPYVGNTSVYKCPADSTMMTNSAGVFPKNRTYSMSSGLNQRRNLLPELIDRPSSVFVFVEEAEVDEGVLVIPYAPKRRWKSNDYPANHHGASYSMSFVDGHAEARPWMNPDCAVPWELGGPDLENLQRMLPERP